MHSPVCHYLFPLPRDNLKSHFNPSVWWLISTLCQMYQIVPSHAMEGKQKHFWTWQHGRRHFLKSISKNYFHRNLFTTRINYLETITYCAEKKALVNKSMLDCYNSANNGLIWLLGKAASFIWSHPDFMFYFRFSLLMYFKATSKQSDVTPGHWECCLFFIKQIQFVTFYNPNNLVTKPKSLTSAPPVL